MASPVFVDLETFSAVDVTTYGGHRVAADPSTRVVLGSAVCVDPFTVWVWTPCAKAAGAEDALYAAVDAAVAGFADDLDAAAPCGASDVCLGASPPLDMIALAQERGLAAHNAEGFDRLVWDAQGWAPVPWLDSAQRARRAALPGQLDELGERLYGHGKDKAGHALVLAIQKMRDPIRDLDARQIAALARYCVRDTLLLAAAWHDARLGDAHPDDPALAADVAVNRRGVAVDLTAVARLEALDAELREEAAARAAAVAPDLNLRSDGQVLAWLGLQGIALPNARASTLRAVLGDPPPDEIVADALEHAAEATEAVVAVIEGRLAVKRVTVGKLEALRAYTCGDGRARGLFAYMAAHTGRWGGRGPQPQNLPRMPKELLSLDVATVNVAGLRAAASAVSPPVTASAAIGSMIRRCFVAELGHLLLKADYSQIEARALLLLAGDVEGLAVYRRGEDPYVVQAARLFDVAPAAVTKPQRQVGKIAVLLCGYGGNTGALLRGAGGRLACDVNPRDVVESWRDAHPRVAGYRTGGVFEARGQVFVRREGGWWKELEEGFRSAAVERVATGPWEVDGSDVVYRLPSGRGLRYRDAELRDVESRWNPGELRPALTFIHPRGYRSQTYGGRLAENCFAKGTRVVSRRGILEIQDVTAADELWDGVEWHRSLGAVCQGVRETGEWLGVRLTPEHRVLCGLRWRCATDLDERASRAALALGRASAPSSWSGQGSGATPSLAAAAIAGPWSRRGRASSTAAPRHAARAASTGRRGSLGAARSGSATCSMTTPQPSTAGRTATRAWCRGAMTRGTGRTRTTGGEGFEFTPRGSRTVRSSTATRSRSTAGEPPDSTSTGSTTPGTTSPATCGSSPAASTRATGAGRPTWSSRGRGYPSSSSTNATALNGPVETSTTTLPADARPSGSWRATGSAEPVYDVVNAGPRRRFMILTDAGPVIVHNCVQAYCRDLVADALVRAEDAGLRVVLHVHDELVVEGSPEDGQRLAEIMAAVPAWAKGLPVTVEGAGEERFS